MKVIPKVKQRNTAYLFSLSMLILFSFSSCQSMLMRTMGIKSIKEFDQPLYAKNVEKLKKGFDSPLSSAILTDTASVRYMALVDSITVKDAYQPVQILYFKQGKLQSYHANCYAKGTITGNLDWTVLGRFDQYIPSSVKPTQHEKWNLQKLSNIMDLGLSDQQASSNDVIVLIWTSAFMKQAMSAKDAIQENLKLAETSTPSPLIVLANNDHFFAHVMREEAIEDLVKDRLTATEYQKYLKHKDR
ncbi:hypothetical protein ACP6L2_06565 [Sphingobacterium lactis]|uniref:hypothetical protein n=1 Tax=Sphingobacterium lactis TaxID=797291 RepID=UPI003F7D9588